uniref:Uncharacterized protein n=1 Tax=Podoviridae sp. cttxo15 TaxID=2826584 RepID=A0A8S5N1L3_9CAUD|nr:MAG TPA: hypothetical protein [Podoviridae sp. cttxo15]
MIFSLYSLHIKLNIDYCPIKTYSSIFYFFILSIFCIQNSV